MFHPLSLCIGLRYIRAKRRTRFISFISLVSMIGIALSVMVLITVMSVMNGFDQQIRSKIDRAVPHITVMSGKSDFLPNWQTLLTKLTNCSSAPVQTPAESPVQTPYRASLPCKYIRAAAPFVEGQGLLNVNGAVRPVMVTGILPEYQRKVDDIANNMIAGTTDKLIAGQFKIVVGERLAESLGIGIGEKISLITSQYNITPIGLQVRTKLFTVVGIFKSSGGFGIDSNSAFIALADAQKLFVLPAREVTGVRLKVNDLFAVNGLTAELQQSLGFDYLVTNWTNHFGAFYHAVEMEKTALFFILTLLIAIATFNLVASLVMLVNDKQSDIAIMRTLGATPSMVRNIFIIQGVSIGIIGTILGLIGGIVLSLNATHLVDVIQKLLHVQVFTPGVYWVDYLPSQLLLSDLINVTLIALLLSFLATIYPAWKAARTQPVEALRYE